MSIDFNSELASYLPSLVFEDARLQSVIEKKCQKALKKGAFSIRQKWLSAFYAKELEETQRVLTAPNFPQLEIRWINPEIGYGVFAKKKIEKNTFIGEYTGIVRRKKIWGSVKNHDYSFEYLIGEGSKSRYYIDASKQGNITRFINHGSKPNLEPAAIFHNNQVHIILFAIQTIQPETELCYDYGEEYWVFKNQS